MVDKIGAKGCNRISCGWLFHILWFVFHYVTFYGWASAECQNEKKKKIYRLKDKKTKSERKIESETEIQTEEQYEKFNELNVILKKGEDLALKEKS